VTDKIDQLDKLKIDRSAVPTPPKRWPWVAAIAVMAGAGVLYLIFAARNAPIEVEVQVVRPDENQAGGTIVLDASGYVVARRQATVSSKIAGKIQQVLIEEGMAVKKDQIVATLDDSSQRAQLALAEAELNSARAALAETRALLNQAELDLQRVEELASRKLASESERDAARANAESLRARLTTGNVNVVVARRGVDVSRDQLNNTIIRAPFAGVVVTKNAQPGEMISPISAGGGFTRTGICTIVDMQSLEIEVDVNEAYIQRIRAGQQVNAVLDAYPDWQIPAEVIAIVPTADRQKATVRVRIGFREKDDRVLRDMGVKVSFLGSDALPAAEVLASISIARDALQSDTDGNYVWVVRGDEVQRRAVVVGPSSPRGQQIISGLSAGDRIVVLAATKLSAGKTVRISN